MINKFTMLVLLIFITTSNAHAELDRPENEYSIFKAKNGATFVWDERTSRIRTPHAQNNKIFDCGDEFQTCLTDRRGFALSYFRNCNDVDYKRLKFHPNVVSTIHNHFWLVYDASPNYMFHYVVPKGVVGIYISPTSSFDFRRLLLDRNLRIGDFDAMEYKLTGLKSVAPCKIDGE